ncbi:MAG: four helix bundle protein [Bacteroidota bacterium]
MSTERENTSFFRFEDLRIYHKALDYIEWVHQTVQHFPPLMKESLTLPFLKSAQAISLNIAEGSSRNKSQFIYFLKMAKSSVRECVIFTNLTRKLNLISDEIEEVSRLHLMELTKMIGSLIVSLQKGPRPASQSDIRSDFDDDIMEDDDQPNYNR